MVGVYLWGTNKRRIGDLKLLDFSDLPSIRWLLVLRIIFWFISVYLKQRRLALLGKKSTAHKAYPWVRVSKLVHFLFLTLKLFSSIEFTIVLGNIENFLFSAAIDLLGIVQFNFLHGKSVLLLLHSTDGSDLTFFELFNTSILCLILYSFFSIDLIFKKLNILSQFFICIFEKAILILKLLSHFDRFKQFCF